MRGVGRRRPANERGVEGVGGMGPGKGGRDGGARREVEGA